MAGFFSFAKDMFSISNTLDIHTDTFFQFAVVSIGCARYRTALPSIPVRAGTDYVEPGLIFSVLTIAALAASFLPNLADRDDGFSI
jgi:hypothetical protein